MMQARTRLELVFLSRGRYRVRSTLIPPALNCRAQSLPWTQLNRPALHVDALHCIVCGVHVLQYTLSALNTIALNATSLDTTAVNSTVLHHHYYYHCTELHLLHCTITMIITFIEYYVL